ATYSPTEVNIYVDGVAQNTWTVSEAEGNSVKGLFTNGADLTYVCLGGNQAWAFEDVDPAFMFDDLVIYADALTTAEMDVIMAAKMPTSINNPEVDANGSIVSEAYFSITGAQVGSEFEALAPGIYIKRAVYSNGAVKSSKIVKANR
ncbi:MAG: LamG domain-containing protein, partial [Bacteroidales bacterium]|nr:LamG domain-containing protein [Bacteroidales bacterium]